MICNGISCKLKGLYTALAINVIMHTSSWQKRPCYNLSTLSFKPTSRILHAVLFPWNIFSGVLCLILSLLPIQMLCEAVQKPIYQIVKKGWQLAHTTGLNVTNHMNLTLHSKYITVYLKRADNLFSGFVYVFFFFPRAFCARLTVGFHRLKIWGLEITVWNLL